MQEFPAIPKLAKPRDLRLDFWRGLCIIDMVLIHLIEQGLRTSALTESLLFDYVRFAAGGFILMAGLCVGAIYLPRARDPQKRRGVYLNVLRRAGFVLVVHYLSEFYYLLLCPLRGEHLDMIQTVRDIVLLRQGYDLLPFYVMMLAVCPLLLELMRRGLWWIVAAGSLLVFAIDSINPWALRLPIHHHFFPLLWQVIFVAGLFAGALLPWYDKLARKMKLQLAIAAWSWIVLLLAMRDHYFGLNVGLSFEKVPLSAGETMRYIASTLAIVITTDLLWRWIEPLSVRRFVNRLGRRSLGVFVLHIWIVGWLVKLSTLLPYDKLLAIGYMIAAVLILWMIVYGMDNLSKLWKEKFPIAPRMEYATLPAMIGGVLLVLCVINPFIPPKSAAPPQLDLARPAAIMSANANVTWH